MRITSLAISAKNLTKAIALIAVGLVVMALPFIASLQREVVTFLLRHKLFMITSGLAIGTFGVWRLRGLTSKRFTRYYCRSGNRAVAIENSLVNEYLTDYWNKLFPNQRIYSEVLVKGDKLHLVADLPYYPEEKQRTLLTKVEHDLTKLFSDVFDYYNSFSLAISFKKV